MILKCIILSLGLLLTGCVVNSGPFQPEIVYYPSSRGVDALPSSFVPLTDEERLSEWGRELYLGLRFAKEFDLYRAITCYKRALFVAPQERTFEIEYHLVEAYYLGRKYSEAIEVFESGSLGTIELNVPGFRELLLMLYDSYREIGECGKAERIYQLIDPATQEQLDEYVALETADFPELSCIQDTDLPIFLNTYSNLAMSPRKAQVLNAVLPGAGYLYVGQKKTAATALIINALFTLAAYQFFDRGYIAAGLITTSFELGWYFGGINGAGIAANQINEATYASLGKEYLLQKRLFPILMFQYAF